MSDADDLQRLFTDLKAEDPAVRRMAAFKLGQMRNPVIVPDLIAAANDPDNTVRAFLASALAAVGPSARPRLQTALHHPSAYVRQTVVSALRHMGDSSVVPEIAPLLDDPDETVRQTTADALRAIDTPESREALRRSGSKE